MPVMPFDRNSLIRSECKHNAISSDSARWCAPIDSSSVMRNAELVTVPNAGQEVGLIRIVRRISFVVSDYVHGECWPSIQHRRILSGEKDSTHLRIGCGAGAGILGPFPDRRNVLSNIQLRPEHDIIRSEASVINSRHSIVNMNSFVVDDHWSGDERQGLVRANPWALALTHRVPSDDVIRGTQDYEYQGQPGIYDYRIKRPFGYAGFSLLLGCIFATLSLMLFNKVWSGVYLNGTMHERLGFLGLMLSSLWVCISRIFSLHRLDVRMLSPIVPVRV